MGNPIELLFSGLGHVIGSLFGSQLDFLSGKSCSSVCGPTWDLLCYIENFCIEHLLKFFAVSFLFYIVLLLLYILYKLRIFHCVFRVIFKMVWACFSTFFSAWEHGCHFLFRVLCTVKRTHRRRRRDIEMMDMSSVSDQANDMETSVYYEQENYKNRRRLWSRDHKRNHLQRSLRARNHRVRVGVDGDSVYVTKRKNVRHGDVRVIRTSKHKRSRLLQNKT